MKTFAKLFDTTVLTASSFRLPALLTGPEHIVHLFRDVHGIYPITPRSVPLFFKRLHEAVGAILAIVDRPRDEVDRRRGAAAYRNGLCPTRRQQVQSELVS